MGFYEDFKIDNLISLQEQNVIMLKRHLLKSLQSQKIIYMCQSANVFILPNISHDRK